MPEMRERFLREQPSARRALHEALLDKIGLDDILDRVARLRQRRRDRLDPDRPAGEVFCDHDEVAPVERVEAVRVHLERKERVIGDLLGDFRGAADRGEVAHAAKQPPGDARRAAGAAGDLPGAVIGDRRAEDARAAADDRLELVVGVEIEPDRNAEAVAKRRRQQARAASSRRPA